jgi:hypothetical protein
MMARVLFRIEPLNNDNINNNKIFFIYIQAVVKINDFIYTT